MYRFRIMLWFYLYKNDNNKQKKPVGWASLLME